MKNRSKRSKRLYAAKQKLDNEPKPSPQLRAKLLIEKVNEKILKVQHRLGLTSNAGVGYEVVSNSFAQGFGRTRTTVLDGRRYIVAPMTLLSPGVLNGSKGPLLYEAHDIAKSTRFWDGMPLVHGHPFDPATGAHLSANAPGVKERQHIGHVSNPRTSADGRLQGDGFFDEEATRRVCPELLQALQAGRQIELSTGLYHDSEPAPPGSTHNGREYTHVAREYRPDHLAILTDARGACSIQDGCGVFNQRRCNCPDCNSLNESDPNSLYESANTTWSANVNDETDFDTLRENLKYLAENSDDLILDIEPLYPDRSEQRGRTAADPDPDDLMLNDLTMDELIANESAGSSVVRKRIAARHRSVQDELMLIPPTMDDYISNEEQSRKSVKYGPGRGEGKCSFAFQIGDHVQFEAAGTSTESSASSLAACRPQSRASRPLQGKPVSSGGRNRTYKLRFNRASPYHSASHRCGSFAPTETPRAGHLTRRRPARGVQPR